MQGKLDAAAQKSQEAHNQLSTERERAEAAEERGKGLDRQLVEHHQDSERMLKKKEDLDAELALQVCDDYRQLFVTPSRELQALPAAAFALCCYLCI